MFFLSLSEMGAHHHQCAPTSTRCRRRRREGGGRHGSLMTLILAKLFPWNASAYFPQLFAVLEVVHAFPAMLLTNVPGSASLSRCRSWPRASRALADARTPPGPPEATTGRSLKDQRTGLPRPQTSTARPARGVVRHQNNNKTTVFQVLLRLAFL